MTPSTIIKRVKALENKIDVLLQPLNERLELLLQCEVHVFNQPGDGWCICFNDANTPIDFLDIDYLMMISRLEALDILEKFSI